MGIFVKKYIKDRYCPQCKIAFRRQYDRSQEFASFQCPKCSNELEFRDIKFCMDCKTVFNNIEDRECPLCGKELTGIDKDISYEIPLLGLRFFNSSLIVYAAKLAHIIIVVFSMLTVLLFVINFLGESFESLKITIDNMKILYGRLSTILFGIKWIGIAVFTLALFYGVYTIGRIIWELNQKKRRDEKYSCDFDN